ncbi:AfsR/SARP family transcriptional regulator [Streptomyces sp. NPDC007863]|uniref:AfsR/SARP family transcriptional regulator n=1 Tax=Streptomyces sp. NPDC007863 TaxID=3154894 RepID=UPI003411E8FD
MCGVRFNLLGPFEIITDDGRVHRPGTPKVCQTLALLLTRPNEVVASEALIRELWGAHPPRSAQTTLQTYVYHARRMLVSECGIPANRQIVTTRSRGYVAEVEADEIDLLVFEGLINQAQEDLELGSVQGASARLREALALWRGPVLSTVRTGEVLASAISHVEELRIRALELRIETEHRLGRYRETIPELRMRVQDYPLNEWFHGQLIRALSQAGRRAEALQAYQNLRRLLNEELGLEPSPEVQMLQREVLGSAPVRKDVIRAEIEVTPLRKVSLAG